MEGAPAEREWRKEMGKSRKHARPWAGTKRLPYFSGEKVRIHISRETGGYLKIGNREREGGTTEGPGPSE